jgi:hypothetical protein
MNYQLMNYQGLNPFLGRPWCTLYTGAQGYNSHMPATVHVLQTTEWASVPLTSP